MTEAGKDAYLALKRLVHRLYTTTERRRSSKRLEIQRIELRDADSGLIVKLPHDLPDRAYRQLLKIKLPPLPDGYSPDRLQCLDDHWILQVRVPVPDHLKDDDALWAGKSTVNVPLVWYSRGREWRPSPEGRRGDHLFLE